MGRREHLVVPAYSRHSGRTVDDLLPLVRKLVARSGADLDREKALALLDLKLE